MKQETQKHYLGEVQLFITEKTQTPGESVSIHIKKSNTTTMNHLDAAIKSLCNKKDDTNIIEKEKELIIVASINKNVKLLTAAYEPLRRSELKSGDYCKVNFDMHKSNNGITYEITSIIKWRDADQLIGH